MKTFAQYPFLKHCGTEIKQAILLLDTHDCFLWVNSKKITNAIFETALLYYLLQSANLLCHINFI